MSTSFDLVIMYWIIIFLQKVLKFIQKNEKSIIFIIIDMVIFKFDIQNR